MRGLAVVLMALDHARGAFDAAHFHGDSFVNWHAGTALPTASFLVRWITHFCAPAFLWTMGCGMALRVAAARERGESEAAIDRRFVRRGLLLMALDPLWMWWAFAPDLEKEIAASVVTGVQVLFALGVTMLVLVFLRRLPPRRLVVGAVVAALCCEGVIGVVMLFVEHVDPAQGRWPSLPSAFLLSGGITFGGRVAVLYPILPWLPLAVLGYAFGARMREEGPDSLARSALRFALPALALFLVVRAANGYGNLLLYREGLEPLQWLHVSKYPPSLSYVALELGLVGCALAAFARARPDAWALRPLLVFGRAPLFFYLLHVHLLTGVALALGRFRQDGLWVSTWAALGVLVVLYPGCRWFLARKLAHPHRFTRWLS